ncbi:hypothetical protein IW262DRAFT_170478 [Armillaria fumosa]|nr:hypothetical protein IW262DRAFT_170478 [Armillaria fumosa]
MVAWTSSRSIPSVFVFTGFFGQAVSADIEDVKPYCTYCCRLGSEPGRVCRTLLNVCTLPLTNSPRRRAVLVPLHSSRVPIILQRKIEEDNVLDRYCKC